MNTLVSGRAGALEALAAVTIALIVAICGSHVSHLPKVTWPKGLWLAPGSFPTSVAP